ncbi:MAG: hypothetical protein HW390_3586 [Candidatus Brocadiaceae bacterium]|nr:hypothetical protein [Candidatus Brocadiaceae bacterium]
MASNTLGHVALMPIKPQFAQLIMQGKKKAEFRKVRFLKQVSHVVVYASSPVQKILGYFEVSHIDEGSPVDIWKRYRAIGGIIYREFQDYYADATHGVVIGIGRTYQLKHAIPLAKLDTAMVALQSFAYIPFKFFEKIREYAYPIRESVSNYRLD